MFRKRITRGAACCFCLPSPVTFPATRPKLSEKAPANVHKIVLAIRDRVHRQSRVSPACYMGVRCPLPDATSGTKPRLSAVRMGLSGILATGWSVSPNETGAPFLGSSRLRCGGRSATRRCLPFYPLRPGPNRIFEKLPDISVLGVLLTHDAKGRGVYESSVTLATLGLFNG